MKKFLALVFFILCLSACSTQAWLAKFYMVKADDAFAKSHAMRIKRDDSFYQERLKEYRTSCDYFTKAYQINNKAFTLNRIGEAVEACLRVEDFKNEKMF